MIKILDIDKLFDNYISNYVYANIGKVKPEEIENMIPKLYVEFGDKSIQELDNKTPNSYYRQFSAKELLACLKTHLEKGVAVSDFLCEALTDKNDVEKEISNELSSDLEEEYTLYLMNILDSKNSSVCIKRYLEFITWDYSEGIRELATESLCKFADLIKEDVLAVFSETTESKKENLTEILSNCKQDDRVYEILINEFVKHGENVPLYAGYLAKYGDEKALPFLMVAIENDKINYQDFEELRFAIEALGGEYTKTRDFTKDKIYKKIKGEKKTDNIDVSKN